MKTHKDIVDKIHSIEDAYKHVLSGSIATLAINAPRALEQLTAETKLRTLNWVIGRTYKSQLRGVDK